MINFVGFYDSVGVATMGRHSVYIALTLLVLVGGVPRSPLSVPTKMEKISYQGWDTV
jgi:hypothetical protein